MARPHITVSATDGRTFDVPAYRHGTVAVHHGIDREGNPLRLNGWTVTHLATGYSILAGIGADRDQVSNVARGFDLIIRAQGDHDTKEALMKSPTASAIKAYLRRVKGGDVDRLWRPKASAGRRTRSWIEEQARDAIEEVRS